MKYLVIMLLLLGACKKQGTEEVPSIPGGKGGNYNIAIFPQQGSAGVTGKVFIKYGTKASPLSYSEFSDSSATMVEPGFGPHAHFFALKAGFYAIAAYGTRNGNFLKADTLIEITEGQKPSVDYILQLK